MIIRRRYATYGQMLQDVKAKEIIIRALYESSKKYEYDEALDILQGNSWLIIRNTDMGSLIPGDAYQRIVTELDALDKLNPFDNGFTYRDISGTLFFPSRKGKALMQILYNKTIEQPTLIVQVIAYEYNGDTITPIEPWDIGTICIP